MVASRSPNLDELATILDDIERDDERASKVIRRLRRLLTRGTFEPQESTTINPSGPRPGDCCAPAAMRSRPTRRRRSYLNVCLMVPHPLCFGLGWAGRRQAAASAGLG